ncbi:MAG TPA: DNA mismatch repair endonuclease MutL [Firmicutes bacterium]|nr:DNA mismatch repair endonuclease MutL [Bacillota bacterium]
MKEKDVAGRPRSRIGVLAEDVIQKIAAGEVIESPASVVKELVENSLDAGARRVEVEIAGAGKELIRVTDDGEGIVPEDLPLAVMPHATSKLKRSEDLAAIHTLGFRGEALASIAAVSRLELISRPPELPHATRLTVTGGVAGEPVPAAGPPGTTVVVRELFFNTPARFKFLPSEAGLRRAVAETVARLALAHPEVAFRLLVEGEEKFVTPGDGNLGSVAVAWWGTGIARSLLPVPLEEGLAGKVSGVIGSPGVHRSNRQDEVFVLNGRVIESRSLAVAVERAYESLLPARRFPLAVLRLELDPAAVDVNVHPAKREVRFRDEAACFRLVHFACVRALQQSGTAAKTLAGDLQAPGGGFVRPSGSHLPAGRAAAPAGARGESSRPGELPLGLLETAREAGEGVEEVGAVAEGRAGLVGKGPAAAGLGTELPLRRALEELRVIGQFHRTYLLGETSGALWLIDQHIAHERVIFEELQEEYDQAGGRGERVVQELLLPVTVELPPALAAALPARPAARDETPPGAKAAAATARSGASAPLSFWEEMERLGFRCEPFGPGYVLVRSLPVAWRPLGGSPGEAQGTGRDRRYGEGLAAALEAAFAEAWAAWSGEKVGSDGAPWEVAGRRRILATIACHAAVKAGEPLEESQMKELVTMLARTRHPFSCPHGRPIVVEIPLSDVERRFGRPVSR